MKKVVRAFLKVLVAIIVVATVISAAVSVLFRASFLESLITLMFLGGIAILALAVLSGAGFAEYGYYGTDLMYVSSHYAKTITADRPRRRREQTEAMVAGFVIGLGLIGVAALLAYSPWLAPAVVAAMVVLVYWLGR